MKILILAPHPFFQERGTPIAVKLLIETLIKNGYCVDLLTYHEGENLGLKNLKIYRIPNIPFLKNIPIGFSWKKIICDFFLTLQLLILFLRNKYTIIHAVEESVFPAIIIKKMFNCKLVYDMDSSMSDQLVEKWSKLNSIKFIFDKFELFAIKNSDLIIPMCEDLAEKVLQYDTNKKVYVLEDVAFEFKNIKTRENLKKDFNQEDLLALYVGNLEHYQGIDLLLDSLSPIKNLPIRFLIIGGKSEDILKYQKKAQEYGLNSKVKFIGPRPLKNITFYLSQADILLSPRIKGTNTPMKIYSYLASGKVTIATNIKSHTQVLNSTVAYLVDPNPNEFSKGLKELISNKSLRNKIGKAAKKLAEDKYSIHAYQKKLTTIYQTLQKSTI